MRSKGAIRAIVRSGRGTSSAGGAEAMEDEMRGRSWPLREELVRYRRPGTSLGELNACFLKKFVFLCREAGAAVWRQQRPDSGG